jgi:hypothetical protein
MWEFLKRREDTPLARVLQAIVTAVVAFFVARAFGLGTGAAAASAVALVLPLDLLFAFARRQPPEQATSDAKAT